MVQIALLENVSGSLSPPWERWCCWRLVRGVCLIKECGQNPGGEIISTTRGETARANNLVVKTTQKRNFDVYCPKTPTASNILVVSGYYFSRQGGGCNQHCRSRGPSFGIYMHKWAVGAHKERMKSEWSWLFSQTACPRVSMWVYRSHLSRQTSSPLTCAFLLFATNNALIPAGIWQNTVW